MKNKKNRTKIIAYYLPQFHEIEENNKWWGEGFTEWTNTRSAKPLFWGHHQPKEPLNENYYDLKDVGVMEKQASLARKYGIYGFCFYHYWFNGKKLLEKPVENLLKAPKVNIPYCFMWANEPWSRTWDGINGNNATLIKQEYGGEKEWEEHFLYLIDFFRDIRYIHFENKPVFLIYKAKDIPRCDAMLQYWDYLAKQYGFKGLYYIQADTFKGYDKKSKKFDAIVEFEPRKAVSEFEVKRWEDKYRIFLRPFRKIPNISKYYFTKRDYDEVYHRIINRKYRGKDKKTYLGSFVDWDNTARKGEKGEIFYGGSPAKFSKYLNQLIERSNELDNEFLFLNAWNEWAEGAYLEADKKYGHAYLHAVRRALELGKLTDGL